MQMVFQAVNIMLLFILVFSLPLEWRCVPCFLPMELILLYLTAIPRQLWMLRQQKNFKTSFHVCSVFCLISFHCHSQMSDTMSDIEVTAKTVFEMRSKCLMLPLKFLAKWNAWEGENKIIMPVIFMVCTLIDHSYQPDPVDEKLLNYCEK